VNILMLASENDALPNGKVGGIGDVIRDLPRALAAAGHSITVITPGYQWFSTLPGAQLLTRFDLAFSGFNNEISLYQVPAKDPVGGVRHLVVEHPVFGSAGVGKIYCNDPPDKPFASDGIKFALFSLAVAEAFKRELLGQFDTIHLHDWHAASFATLRALHPEYAVLQQIPCVYTIHNLALQGIRPLRDDNSSLHVWYDGAVHEDARIIDPRYSNCYNPMRAAINLCDRVHVVSPTYAEEVMRPSQPEEGFFGGEGLEADLLAAKDQQRLVGILNGVDYSGQLRAPISRDELFHLLISQMRVFAAEDMLLQSVHSLAADRLQTLLQDGEHHKLLLTSVGRISDQKMLILRQRLDDGRFAIDALLDTLAGHGCFVMVGNGDVMLEQLLYDASKRHPHFVFLQGFYADLGQRLYENGDLFIMPSSFEPCGISQMIAMRHGQPCLVHAVGGLCDTVKDGETGFSFAAKGLIPQAHAMVETLHRAIQVLANNPSATQQMRTLAAAQRFSWEAVVPAYLEQLYLA
jgi:starch synthase